MKYTYYYTVTINDYSTRTFNNLNEAEEYRNKQIKQKLNGTPGKLKPGDVVKVSDVLIKYYDK